jgi:hypothetical protein
VNHRGTAVIGAVRRGSFEVGAAERKFLAREVTMQKVETVLVPIDFSDESGAALRCATRRR